MFLVSLWYWLLLSSFGSPASLKLDTHTHTRTRTMWQADAIDILNRMLRFNPKDAEPRQASLSCRNMDSREPSD